MQIDVYCNPLKQQKPLMNLSRIFQNLNEILLKITPIYTKITHIFKLELSSTLLTNFTSTARFIYQEINFKHDKIEQNCFISRKI